jgi:hypothetical protein
LSLEIRMTKDRVAVGKIESWLQEFESCLKRPRRKGTDAWQSATVPGREQRDMGLKSSIYSEFGSQSSIV